MNEKVVQSERGQTVVIVAFAIIALLAFAGLAIDGGTAYLNRRRMQNAADSGALAGTMALAQAACDQLSPTGTDAEVLAAMNEYAIRNGVDSASDVVGHYVRFDGNTVVEYSPPVAVGSGSVPNGAVGIVVTTTITRPTYLLSLIGQPEGGAKGTAIAVSGPPLLAGGIRPFGVPLQMMQQTDAGDAFTVDFDHNGGTITWVTQSGYVVQDQHRGWMNLAYMWNKGENPTWGRAIDQSADANIISQWMRDGWNGTIYADCFWSQTCGWGDYIHAKPGTMASAVCDAPLHTLFYVPIYDIIPDCATEVTAPKPPCPTQGSGYVYHIVGFAGMVIDSCNQGSKEITAHLVETIMGQGVPSPNAGFGSDICDFNTLVVSLWR
jgi:Flp pilus assembly protein TadG